MRNGKLSPDFGSKLGPEHVREEVEHTHDHSHSVYGRITSRRSVFYSPYSSVAPLFPLLLKGRPHTKISLLLLIMINDH